MSNNLKNARLKFFFNIVVPSIFTVLLFMVTLFFIVLPYFEKSMMDRKREMITELTNTATSILEKYHRDEMDSLLTREEAQKTAISRIQYLRYGEENKDYFWITDMKPVMIVHPYRPDLNGKDLSNFEDSHGKKMFVEFVSVVKKDKHGYVEYMWQWKDDSTQIVPKISYVKAFEPWGWIIGTGIYVEDVKAEISVLTRRFVWISIIISFIIALILSYVGRQSFNIERKRILAESELSQSREKYRSLVEASTDGLLMLMDNKIIFVNQIFENLCGKTIEALNNVSIDSVLQLPEEINTKIVSGDFNFDHISLESKLLSLEGKETDVLIVINPIKFYDQDAVVFSVKDMSSDKQVEEELVQNKDKFKSLMDKLNLGIFRIAINNKGSFIEANAKALNILGFKDFAELSGLYILDLFVEKEDKLHFRTELLYKGFLKNRVIKLRKKNGEHIFASVSLVVIGNDNNPGFCEGIIQDISIQSASDQDSLSSGFTEYMQVLSQPAIKFMNKSVFCEYNSSISQMADVMKDNKTGVLILTGPEGETLGYVTDSSLRNINSTTTDLAGIKAFQIMNSPLVSVDEYSTLTTVISLLNADIESIVFAKNSFNKISGYLTRKEIYPINEFLPFKTADSIATASTAKDLKQIYVDYIGYLVPLIEINTHSSVIFSSLAFISENICKRLIDLAILKYGEPPVKFAYISMGSEGRREQTLSTDQDNAIIYDDSADDDAKKYFANMAGFISENLDAIGYSYCKGGIMAMNPVYCQPLSVWKSYFSKWINNGSAKDLLDISIFFDFRLTFGESSYVEELRNHISQLTERNPAYLFLLAQNNLKLKPQVGFWGNILLETAGAPPETVNIKEAIAPIVNFARIYALKNGITAVNTQERLKILLQREILTESSYKNASQAFDVLGMMRLNHQAALFKNGLKPDNLVSTRQLSELDQAIIKKVLSHINTMLSKLSFDFKGSI